ncbi:MAG: 50S ribosomal protein L9 [Chloroflexi bacterium]|nr:50S ribosomal protein L9 [Chloroflexota bacterium]
MKVILLKDVDNLGRVGDVKEVSAGYARNFLLRQAMVVEATPSQLKRIDSLKVQRKKEDDRRHAEAMTLAERIGTLSVTVDARAGEGGKLFGTVTTADVVAALKAQHAIEIDRRNVELDGTVRTVGDHSASIKLAGQVQASLKVEVVATEA